MNNYGIIFYRNYNNNLLKSFDIVLKEKPSKLKEKGYFIQKNLVMYILKIINISFVINLILYFPF